LVDCGFSVFPKLVERDLVKDIDAVLITHLHDDHVGSLSVLIYYATIVVQRPHLVIVVPNAAFEAELRAFLTHSQHQLDQRVRFAPLTEFPQVRAIDTFGTHVPGMRSWAYAFDEEGQHVAYSGDTGQAALIFQTLMDWGWQGALVFHEVIFWPGIVSHSYYKDVEAYLDRFRIYGYHCDPQHAPADLRLPLAAQHPDWELS
jgi:glyoxylase-like metal-dependent hydrolase (beta-lactamase superfamily II)